MKVTRTALLSATAAALSAASFLFAGQCMTADDDSAGRMVSATSAVESASCSSDCIEPVG